MNCHRIIKKKMQVCLFLIKNGDDKINLCLYKINFIVVLSENDCLKGVFNLEPDKWKTRKKNLRK